MSSDTRHNEVVEDFLPSGISLLAGVVLTAAWNGTSSWISDHLFSANLELYGYVSLVFNILVIIGTLSVVISLVVYKRSLRKLKREIIDCGQVIQGKNARIAELEEEVKSHSDIRQRIIVEDYIKEQSEQP
jgi:Na+/proline symporter